jgi:hypothetical protein
MADSETDLVNAARQEDHWRHLGEHAIKWEMDTRLAAYWARKRARRQALLKARKARYAHRAPESDPKQ